MVKAIGLGAVSMIAGIGAAFFNPGIGVVVSVSIMGAGIIAALDKR